MGEVKIAFQDTGNRLMIGEFAAIVRGQRENLMFDGGRISDQRPPTTRAVPLGSSCSGKGKARAWVNKGEHIATDAVAQPLHGAAGEQIQRGGVFCGFGVAVCAVRGCQGVVGRSAFYRGRLWMMRPMAEMPGGVIPRSSTA